MKCQKLFMGCEILKFKIYNKTLFLISVLENLQPNYYLLNQNTSRKERKEHFTRWYEGFILVGMKEKKAQRTDTVLTLQFFDYLVLQS